MGVIREGTLWRGGEAALVEGADVAYREEGLVEGRGGGLAGRVVGVLDPFWREGGLQWGRVGLEGPNPLGYLRVSPPPFPSPAPSRCFTPFRLPMQSDAHLQAVRPLSRLVKQ